MKIKYIFEFIILLFFIYISASDIFGTETAEAKICYGGEFSDEMEIFKKAVPDDIKKLIPDGLFELNPENRDFITDGNEAEFLLKSILAGIKSAFMPAAGTMAAALALIIICAVFNTLKDSFSNASMSSVFDMCCGISVSMTLFEMQHSLFIMAQNWIMSLCQIMNSMIPVMGAVLTASGNFSGAAVSGAMMMLFITLLENICTSALMPVMNICFSLSLVSTVSGSVNLSGISNLVRWIYTFSLTLIMMVFGFVMSVQSVLAQSADSFAFKTIRFMIGGMIPIVGGSVSDALRTVGGSISFIKNSVGIAGIVIIVVMFIPVLSSLIINKFSLSVCAVVSDILDCGRESGLIREMSGLCGFVIALTAVSSVFFIFTLTIFVNTALAVTG